MLEDKDLLLEMIQDAASGYSCDASDSDFEVIVRIKCDDGWTKVELLDPPTNG